MLCLDLLAKIPSHINGYYNNPEKRFITIEIYM